MPLDRPGMALDEAKNVHAIGDRANHVVLNAIEAVMGDDLAAGTERRFRLEHAQIMTEDDLKRAVRLGGASTIGIIL